MGLSPGELAERLGAVLSGRWGRETTVSDLRRLSGGASMETWSFIAEAGERRPLILRKERAGPRMGGLHPMDEARLISIAADAGVPVPRLIASGGADDVGSAYLITEFIDGETIPRKLLRDDAYRAARPRMVGQVAQALGRIHRVSASEVEFLGEPRGTEAFVRDFAGALVALDDPSPALELGVRWLLRNLPPEGPAVLVHGDLRNGNLIVGPEGLQAVLDWELAHVGAPAEDLGWFCVRAWRFGVDSKQAGGFGTRDELLEAYGAASGHTVTREELRFWEVFGTLKWGVVCMSQAAAHLSGATR